VGFTVFNDDKRTHLYEERLQGARTLLVVEAGEETGTFLMQALSQETSYHPMWLIVGFTAFMHVHD